MTETNQYLNVHQDLIDLCMQHDRNAQRKIYQLYYHAMFNTAFRLMKDRHSAEDMMQEAFLKAFQKIHTYNNTSSFGAWLKRIVINECINKLRKNKKEFYTEETYLFEDAEEQLVSDKDWKKANIKIVKQSLENLNSRYRTIINLILLEGYDLQEVAEIMDISYANARVLYMRAKNKLQDLVFSKID